LQIFQVHGPC